MTKKVNSSSKVKSKPDLKKPTDVSRAAVFKFHLTVGWASLSNCKLIQIRKQLNIHGTTKEHFIIRFHTSKCTTRAELTRNFFKNAIRAYCFWTPLFEAGRKRMMLEGMQSEVRGGSEK